MPSISQLSHKKRSKNVKKINKNLTKRLSKYPHKKMYYNKNIKVKIFVQEANGKSYEQPKFDVKNYFKTLYKKKSTPQHTEKYIDQNEIKRNSAKKKRMHVFEYQKNGAIFYTDNKNS